MSATVPEEWVEVRPRCYLGPDYRYHWQRRYRHTSGASVQLRKEMSQDISVVAWLPDGRYKSIGHLPRDGHLYEMAREAWALWGQFRPFLDALQDEYDLWSDTVGVWVPQYDWTSPVRLACD